MALRMELNKFYHDRVEFPRDEMKYAKEIILRLIDVLRRGFRDCSNGFPINVGEPVFCGSVWEGVKTENCREFDVDFPLHLDSDAWDARKLKNHDQSFGPYICFLKNHFDDDDGILLSYGTNYRTERNIDPGRIKTAFKEMIEKILTDDYEFSSEIIWRIQHNRNSKNSPSVKMDVWQACNPNYVMSIDIVPALHILKPNKDEVYLVPKGNSGYWRRSFSIREKNLVKTMDKGDDGCRREMLRILKTVASKNSNTPLSRLDSYTLKNAILNLHDSGNWHQNNLGGCFERVLHYLKDCFYKGELPRYFEEKHNLLNEYKNEDLVSMAKFLQEIIDYRDYSSLLFGDHGETEPQNFLISTMASAVRFITYCFDS